MKGFFEPSALPWLPSGGAEFNALMIYSTQRAVNSH